MGKKGAASGSGTAPKQSVTVSKQSQSENASQTSASGEKVPGEPGNFPERHSWIY